MILKIPLKIVRRAFPAPNKFIRSHRQPDKSNKRPCHDVRLIADSRRRKAPRRPAGIFYCEDQRQESSQTYINQDSRRISPNCFSSLFIPPA